MPPLGGQATGYPFQGSRRLHPQHPVHRGDKGGEVSTFLEASLQIHLLLPLFSLVEALDSFYNKEFIQYFISLDEEVVQAYYSRPGLESDFYLSIFVFKGKLIKYYT